MGNRREPRVDMSLAVRIFGTDANGQIFSEKVTTVNVSRNGLQVSGAKSKMKLDEIVGASFGQNKSQFRVKWVGKAGSLKAGHIGLLNLDPKKALWDLHLPGVALDPFQKQSVERRQHPRLKATISVQLYPEGESAIWGTSTDLGIGGCYVEMPIPLKAGTKLKVKLWLGENRLLAGGKVINSTPGFGFGIQFTEIAEKDLQLLKVFLRSITEV
jgi:PilZ domain